MRAFNDAQLNKTSFRIPSGVTLRECSVVIIGSTCKICGRDFKCESDVSLHSRWRHNGTIGSLIDDLHHEIYLENSQKCDICDVQFQIASDLKIHKRLIHKHGTRSKYRKKRRRKETVRVKFKLNGMTTMDVNLNRKYLKMENNLKYFNTGTQTPDSLEIEKHQNNCAAHIDLFLSDHIMDNNHIQHIRPHKAANRYIVGKFTSTKGDAIARSTTVVGRSLLEISNTSHRDVIPDSNKSCEEYENHSNFISQENTVDPWIRSFLNNLDTYNKENSQRNLNEPKRKNVCCQAEFLLNDNNGPLIYQREKFVDKTSLTSKQLANEIRYDPIKQFNKAAKDKRSAELINSLADSEEIVTGNENNKIYETATKHSLAPLTRNFFNKKIESIKDTSNVDDDIQEVLRITRRNVQSDINHESPNRTEREILIQNTDNKLLTFPVQRKSTIYPEKCNAGFTANFEPSSYPAFTTVTESSYQFLANAFNKKLDIYLEDMHHLGISYYNDLTKINNNNLEDYAMYAHQGFFESRMQAEEP